MPRGRSWSMLAALLGATTLGLGLAACGGSGKAPGTTTIDPGTHTRTHASSTTPGGADTTTSSSTTSSTSGGGNTTTIGHSTTTRSSGSGSGSGSAGSSGGAGLSGDTTRTATTTTSTTSTCHGQDCQTGSPTVPGSVPPVNGKCSSGYIYVAAQDGGPALCIPRTTLTTSTTPATQ